MSSESNSKSCPSCFMQIDGRAKKCPYCHAYQGILRYGLAVLIAFLVSLAVVLVAAVAWDAGRLRIPCSAQDYSSDITILTSDLYLRPSSYGDSERRHVTIVGKLTNDGLVPIDRVGCEVQVFNANGKLIDTFTDDIYTHVLPTYEVPFKISSNDPIHLPEAEFATHQIIVRNARKCKR